MSEKYNLGHFFILFFSFIQPDQLDLVLYSLEPLTFVCALGAQPSQYALFPGRFLHFLHKVQNP